MLIPIPGRSFNPVHLFILLILIQTNNRKLPF